MNKNDLYNTLVKRYRKRMIIFVTKIYYLKTYLN